MKNKENNSGNYTDPKIQTDPFGSYTGVAEHSMEQPVQDADDL